MIKVQELTTWQYKVQGTEANSGKKVQGTEANSGIKRSRYRS
nr:hypothetical protein [Mycoplasmopsis bovis]